jgi:hypothetical protein
MPHLLFKINPDELSLSYNRTSYRINVHAIDYPDAISVANAVYAYTPAIFLGLTRSDVDIRANEDGRTYDVSITYSAEPSDEAVDSSPPSPTKSSPASDTVDLSFGYSISAEAQQIHVTSAISQGRVGTGNATASGTNLQCVAFAEVVPDGIAPNPAHEGRTIFVTGGPSAWTYGPYRIVALNGTRWVLDRNPAPVGASGGVWIMPADAPDFENAINVAEDSIEGCDIAAPSLSFERRITIPVVNVAYIQTAMSLIGKVNKKRFYHFEPGEVLYLGCVADKENASAWKVTHKFRVERNRRNIRITKDITVPLKRGHDYLWVKYRPTARWGIVVQEPIAAYVSVVYEEADFSLLGIGT